MTAASSCPFSSTAPLLSLLDFASPALRDDPYPQYRWYREHDPVHRREPASPGGDIRYFLTRYADVKACLMNKHLGRETRASLWDENIRAIPPEHLDYVRTVRELVLFMDPPRHSKVRLTFNRILDEDYTRNLRSRIEHVASTVLRNLPTSGEFDFMSGYAIPLPLILSRHLLGLDDHLGTQELSHIMSLIYASLSGSYNDMQMTAASSAMRTLNGHFHNIIARRRTRGVTTGDFVDRVLQFADTEHLLKEHQVIPSCVMLLAAIMKNITNMIGNGLLTLLRHPTQLALLRSMPELMPNAVKEILRYESPLQQMTRHATAPTRIRDMVIEKGAAVTCLFGAANRDPEVFPDPDTFDIARETADNAAFGFGIHHCPGANLSIMEGGIALSLFLEKFPDIHLASDHAEWGSSPIFRGLARLPLRAGC